MSDVKGVVVGFDGTATGGAAIEWAAREAERTGLPLTVIHAAEYAIIPGPMGTPPFRPDLFEQEARKIVDEGVELARKIARSVPVAGRTTIAGVTRTLVDSSHQAALLVIGTRGYGQLSAAALGSTAYAVTAHAHCPVVVVRGDSAVLAGPMHPVLVGVDGSEHAAAALSYAADYAVRASAPLTVLTTYASTGHPAWTEAVMDVLVGGDSGESYDAVASQGARKVAATAVRVARERHPDLQVDQLVVGGTAVKALATAAKDCGLLVLGSRGLGAFGGLVLGSVSHGVLHAAPCPVAVISEVAAAG